MNYILFIACDISILIFFFQHLRLKVRDDCTLQIWCPSYMRKIRNKNNKICKSHDTARRHMEWPNVQQLQKHLSLMIKRNQNLIEVLENSADFLMGERNHRLRAEKEYHKLQLRLKSLKNKIALQSSICPYTRYGNQTYENLLNIFENLVISTSEQKFRTNGENIEAEAGESS